MSLLVSIAKGTGHNRHFLAEERKDDDGHARFWIEDPFSFHVPCHVHLRDFSRPGRRSLSTVRKYFWGMSFEFGKRYTRNRSTERVISQIAPSWFGCAQLSLNTANRQQRNIWRIIEVHNRVSCEGTKLIINQILVALRLLLLR